MTNHLDHFLHPRSIAVVGASATPGRVGYNLLANLVNAGFPGSIYPVNPHTDEALGLAVFPGLKDLPQAPELVLLAIRSTGVPEAIRECAEVGARAAIISSAGLGEAGPEGKELERQTVAIAREGGVRLMGPNTQGILNPGERLIVCSTTTFVPSMTTGKGVAYVCQTAYFYWDWVLRKPWLGLAKAIDLGNMCDVTHAEVLDYLGDDPETRVITLHIEGIRDGGEFAEVASRVSRKKPVVALKTGRTSAGARTIASHTGSLAGRDVVYEAAFREAGIVRAMDMDEVVDFTHTFASLSSLPHGRRVGVITTSGAAGSLAADACEEFGLSLAEYSPATVKSLKGVLPAWASIGNPVDIFVSLDVDPTEVYRTAIEAMTNDPNVDAILIITFLTSTMPKWSGLGMLEEYVVNGLRKPTAVTGFRDEGALKLLAHLETSGLGIYSSVRSAARALAAACSRSEYLQDTAASTQTPV